MLGKVGDGQWRAEPLPRPVERVRQRGLTNRGNGLFDELLLPAVAGGAGTGRTVEGLPCEGVADPCACAEATPRMAAAAMKPSDALRIFCLLSYVDFTTLLDRHSAGEAEQPPRL